MKIYIAIQDTLTENGYHRWPLHAFTDEESALKFCEEERQDNLELAQDPADYVRFWVKKLEIT